ncbi:large ribosomal subunit protein uL29m isoform X2 [Coffea arabica]|uniref:Large ribosomal subunit protein uL29m n=1 Tax=Coffea arabica TaxID=13443 RepID=A0ABM4W5R0_COFAR
MSAIRAIGRTLFAAVKADTSSASSAAAAAASTARTKHNPLENFFEADRSPDDDKPVVYGRGWKASELRLKSWDDLQKLWFVLLKEKNMLMTQRQMLHAQNLRFANPERISKVWEKQGVKREDLIGETLSARYMFLPRKKSFLYLKM